MKLVQVVSVRRTVKKLHPNQKRDFNEAVNTILQNPTAGELKTGDLAGVWVYKFKMAKQLMLLAYTHRAGVITLRVLAPHENFYRDLKKFAPVLHDDAADYTTKPDD